MLCGHVALHLAFGVCGLEFPPGAGSLERRSSACMDGCMAGRGFLETKRGWTKSLGGQYIYIYIYIHVTITVHLDHLEILETRVNITWRETYLQT